MEICSETPIYASLTTSRGFLSSRSATNLECRSLSPSVHSRNSITATSLGRTHTHCFIFSSSKISPLHCGSIQISLLHIGNLPIQKDHFHVFVDVGDLRAEIYDLVGLAQDRL